MNRPNPPRRAPAGKPGPKRPTPPDPARLRQAKARRRLVRRQAIRRLSVYAVAVLILYALGVGLFAGSIWLKLRSFATTQPEVYPVFFLDREQDEFAAEPSGTLVKPREPLADQGQYLPLSVLEPYVAFAVGGTALERTLYLAGGTATFAADSVQVTINTEPTSLSLPCRIVDSQLYLPLDFFQNCLNGLQIQFDTQAQQYTVTPAPTVTLGFVEPTVLTPLDYQELSELTRK